MGRLKKFRLHPIMDRPNVSVETYARVSRPPSTRLSLSPSKRRI